MGCKNNAVCQLPIVKECSRNGDSIAAWKYVFTEKITDWLFFYESNFLFGTQVIKKSLGNGLTILDEFTLVFDEVLSDNRKAGSHEGFLKVVVDGETSTILQYSIEIKQKEVS